MKAIPASVLKKLPDNFTTTVDSMSTEELNAKILESEGNIYNITDALDSSEEIADMKRTLKEATQPFRDTKKQEETKITYLLWLQEQRGGEIGTIQEE